MRCCASRWSPSSSSSSFLIGAGRAASAMRAASSQTWPDSAASGSRRASVTR
ncbi:conserved hypothetical protein [Ricinus communis]|uniref:Uncharacterized protein n=1 Tax=Ricinus communis TaxID=3988 RepID=B9TAB1_RICCO|nr:conserved hypothetical protein [Ricinus communis]